MLLIYGLLLKLEWFISPQIPVIQKSDGFLYNRILAHLKPLFDGYPVSYSFIAYFLFSAKFIYIKKQKNQLVLI